MTPTRHHPVLVVLHWGLALFISGALLLGMFVLKEIPNVSPEKLPALRAHMAGGIAILVLMAVRLAVRLSSARPPDATTGNAWLDRIARISHRAFYPLVFAMAATGLATALMSGAFATAFGSGGPLPESFNAFFPRIVHGYIAKALLALVGLHVVGALYHQFIRHDGLLRRMWFGRRSSETGSP